MHSKGHTSVTWRSSRNEQWVPEDWNTHGTKVRKKKIEKKGLKCWQWFFIFFWSQFIFLWAERALPQGWRKAAFPGSHIHHTEEKHHKGDSMTNTWFQGPRIECPEMRIRIYSSPWSLGSSSSNILGKVCFKTPNLFIGLRFRYINGMMLHHILKRFIELFSDLGHTCKLFVMVMASFAESLPLTRAHRSMSDRVSSPTQGCMNPLIRVRLLKLTVGPGFWDQTDLGLNSICKFNVVWP